VRVSRDARRLVVRCGCSVIRYRAVPFESAIVPVKVIHQLRKLLALHR
jgi:hypothetical protein